MPVDVSKIPMYVAVGGEVIQIAAGSISAIRKMLASAPGIEVQNEQLDAVAAKYEDAIDRARRAAEGRD